MAEMGTQSWMSKRTRRFAALTVMFMLSVALTAKVGTAASDNVAYAKEVVKAGQKSKMSRAPLNVGGVRWSGANSSPPPIKNATVAVMPCPLTFTVCKYHFDSAHDA